MAVLGRSMTRTPLKSKVSEVEPSIQVAQEPVTVEEAILAVTRQAAEPPGDQSPMKVQELASPQRTPPKQPKAKHNDASLLSKTIVVPPRQVMVSKKPETPEEASRRAAGWAARRAFKKTTIEELFAATWFCGCI